MHRVPTLCAATRAPRPLGTLAPLVLLQLPSPVSTTPAVAPPLPPYPCCAAPAGAACPGAVGAWCRRGTALGYTKANRSYNEGVTFNNATVIPWPLEGLLLGEAS